MIFFAEKCPLCKKRGTAVEQHTVIHHVKDISKIGSSIYYYCNSSDCDMVYYNKNEQFTTNMINKEIGFKDGSSETATICFCFNYLKSELYKPSIIEKIDIRVGSYGSRCDIRSPSGKCCIKDIKKMQKEYKAIYGHSV
jgi:hypothetical protein